MQIDELENRGVQHDADREFMQMKAARRMIARAVAESENPLPPFPWSRSAKARLRARATEMSARDEKGPQKAAP